MKPRMAFAAVRTARGFRWFLEIEIGGHADGGRGGWFGRRDGSRHQFADLVAEDGRIKPVEGQLGIGCVATEQSQQFGPARGIENKDVLFFAAYQSEDVDFAAHAIHSVPRFRSLSRRACPQLAFVSTDRPSEDQTTFKLSSACGERFDDMPMAAKSYKVFAALKIRLPASEPDVVTKVKVLLK